MKMKKIMLAVVSTLFAGSFAFAASSTVVAKVAKPADAVQILYTQMADSATMEKDPANKDKYKLVLHNVHHRTLWFSDRPQRKAGTMTTENFVKSWSQGQNSFAKDNPNANMISVEDSAHKVSAHMDGVFTLSNPVYNAKDHTLSYDVSNVYKKLVMNDQSAQLQQVTLFIDSGCGMMGGC
jgi:hypothetical protein